MCFFFKQKTAYEMRISDWSSDVCSSDLIGDVADVGLVLGGAAIAVQHQQYRCARIGGGRPHDQEATVLAIVREADVDRCSAARKRQIAALNANYGMSQSGAGELRRSNQKIAHRAGDETRDLGEHAQGGGRTSVVEGKSGSERVELGG